ncbi:efflux RND transporter permease subunit [Fundidesulfovibrio agrisoli]|uniref:efflux RND transporter permease subunit n=1 Tax=Fundidesulfovibrio agrisoli TaxID=2922717 RepID=UPI001FABED4D|nr:efflux RND transporter permease subunit [Fundidesulfovibrio agrisoli]
MSAHEPPKPHGHDALTRITAYFVDSKLVPLVILAALLLGVFAVTGTPSEEEPQIVVPMIDIHVSMPGAGPKEVENRVVEPMEKLLWEIPGVEYVYSTAQDGAALTVVRFKVGEDTEKSTVKTYAKLYQHLDWIPQGCSQPILKPRSIDDVPVVALTFHGGGLDSRQLRTVALQVNEEVRRIPGVSETSVIGGRKRAVMVELDQERLRANGLDAVDVLEALRGQNQGETVGETMQDGQAVSVRLDNFFRSQKELARAVLTVRDSRPVYLGDVARITDGFDEPGDYVFFLRGRASKAAKGQTPDMEPAVTLTVAKRAGENATRLAEEVFARVEGLKGFVIPAGVEAETTRDYGETARAKVHELLEHLLLAALSVGLIVALFLGARASLVVMVAVPVTLAVTLAVYWLLGYTLNRVTLFALIFCIGILVDDPIVDVENIVRHLDLPGSAKRPFSQVIIEAVNEVRAPLVLATFTVIAAIMPMAFVGGLMGPYMRPMPIGASLAMLLSMGVAFVITPWTSKRVLGRRPAKAHAHGDDAGTRLYKRLMAGLIRQPRKRWGFLALVGGLLLLACALFPLKLVLVKMLPFDNKSEFQVVVDMPLGTPLEQTTRVAGELASEILKRGDVADAQVYAGTSGPFSFNGLIRHYYLRRGQNAADIAVNLAPKGERSLQSHEVAKQVRLALAPIAEKYGARLKVAEVPPGPPVIQTLVAEIYGPDDAGRLKVARQVKEVFAHTPEVVDVDWYVDDPQPERLIRIERDKALANGIEPRRALEAVTTALRGTQAGLLHDESAQEDAPVVVRLPLRDRAHADDIPAIPLRGAQGQMVSLEQIASIQERTVPSAIYHKNLQPVVYVTGDMAGKEESPVYGMGRITRELERLGSEGQGAWQAGGREPLPVLYTAQPKSLAGYSMKWDGEWQITYEVFRDMGIAFGVVMILVYILVVGWFGSYTTPIAIMSPIPLSLIGIIPAHALAGAFFTATSMIGFIAGAGIVVRNSIILVDFIEMRRREGASLEDAVVEAGAVRFRPMLLTAIAVVAGAFVILFDPIFQGLAISLMAGEVAATVFSRMVVPVMYYLDQRRAAADG